MKQCLHMTVITSADEKSHYILRHKCKLTLVSIQLYNTRTCDHEPLGCVGLPNKTVILLQYNIIKAFYQIFKLINKALLNL